MKKIVVGIGLLVSLSFAEDVIDKENILHQLQELQKERTKLSQDIDSPHAQEMAMRKKEEEKQAALNEQKIERLKKTINSFAKSINDDITVPRGKYSSARVNKQERFFVFEDDLEELIYQKNTSHQKSDKINVLQAQVKALKATDSAMDIEKISSDINSLLQVDPGIMGSSMSTTTGTQAPLIELREGDFYKDYKVLSKNGSLVLSRFGKVQ